MAMSSQGMVTDEVIVTLLRHEAGGGSIVTLTEMPETPSNDSCYYEVIHEITSLLEPNVRGQPPGH
jgi:hypothetical protein